MRKKPAEDLEAHSPRPHPTRQIPSFRSQEFPLSPPALPKPEGMSIPPSASASTPDWGNLIRSIVSEMVPQIIDQMLAKNKLAPTPGATTVNDMTNQMVGMLSRKASQSTRSRPNFETGSIRSRRLSVASDTESRINIAADMVAAAGVMATEALKSVPPDFVEKKLLTLWSELLDMVEDSIGTDDSFFVSDTHKKSLFTELILYSNLVVTASLQ